MTVEGQLVDLALGDGHTAVRWRRYPPAGTLRARARQEEVDAGGVRPDDGPASGVEGPHLVRVGGEVHAPAHDHRKGLPRQLAEPLRAAPGHAQALDRGGVDLCERGKARVSGGAAE